MQDARRDPTRAVLEGVHAVKHAIRFGATVTTLVAPDPTAARQLLERLAPDVHLPVAVEEVDPVTWEAIAPGGLPSPLLGIAHRPPDTLDAVIGRVGRRPVVLLDAPTHLGNVGAVVRVAAAADAAGMVVVGTADPWHPRAVRGGAGLQFALPVGRREQVPTGPRPLVAVTPDGDPVHDVGIPAGAVLAFGSERAGLDADLVARADRRVRLPMRPGVSSLNLATSVAALLHAGDLLGPDVV